jgi:hypothetical protein
MLSYREGDRMNRYGRIAEAHWRRWLPTRYSEISDPSNFFTTLGQEVEEQVETLSLEIAGDDPPGEGYLDKVGRLNMARQQAEEMVLTEQVLLPAEPGVDPEETEPVPEQGSGGDWIPLREDPSHPFWIDNRAQNP